MQPVPLCVCFCRLRSHSGEFSFKKKLKTILPVFPLQIERRMELVRLVSHNAHKRLVSCLQGQLGVDTEKRQVRSLCGRLALSTRWFTSRRPPREQMLGRGILPATVQLTSTCNLNSAAQLGPLELWPRGYRGLHMALRLWLYLHLF